MAHFWVGLPCCNEPWDVLAATLDAVGWSTRAPARVIIKITKTRSDKRILCNKEY